MTHISLSKLPFYGTYANSEDPDQTPQNAASDQGLQYLLTDRVFHYYDNLDKNEKYTQKFVKLIGLGKSVRHKWVKLLG